ncbi:MAG: glycosyl transferase, partial [bacterium]|nr:glycosyl transferase [bacterium]
SFRATMGPIIEPLYPKPVFYISIFSLIFGNFLYVYYYMIGCAKREQWDLVKYVFLVPVYWLMMSVASWKALWQLIFKPHYWEKTVHGFHLAIKKNA